MKIAVAAESDAGEPQAAATPDTIRKMLALGADVAVEPGEAVAFGWVPKCDFRGAVPAVRLAGAPELNCRG